MMLCQLPLRCYAGYMTRRRHAFVATPCALRYERDTLWHVDYALPCSIAATSLRSARFFRAYVTCLLAA